MRAESDLGPAPGDRSYRSFDSAGQPIDPGFVAPGAWFEPGLETSSEVSAAAGSDTAYSQRSDAVETETDLGPAPAIIPLIPLEDWSAHVLLLG
jgi:hypothetical protein